MWSSALLIALPLLTSTTLAAPLVPPKPYEVIPKAETAPAGLDGDDPAIWVHKKDTAKSVVITTSKEKEDGGLHVFDLDGKVRHNFKLQLTLDLTLVNYKTEYNAKAIFWVS